MKQYKIFADPQGKMEAVKQGWSWPGFFFTAIWALVKKMYLIGVGLFVAWFIFGFAMGCAAVSDQAFDTISRIAQLIASIVFGLFGNKWREGNLQSRGYELKDTVSAKTPENSISLYIKKELTQPVSLEQETKKCPACAEKIKLEARKCHFCGNEVDPEEVDRQVAARSAELAKKKEGKVQCPECGSWDTRWATIEDGGMGHWCDNYKKSLQAMGSS